MTSSIPVSAKLKIISVAYSRALTAHMQSYDLTSSQAMIIGFLVRNGGGAVRQHDIETGLGLKHPTVTGLLERLRQKGFVTFTEGEDRRCKTVSVTDKGTESYEDARRLIRQTDEELFGSLSPERLAELSDILDAVSENARLAERFCCKGGREPC
ncbi:MAG: MarR family transcriptional regulator [Oscillospiraceae bacterium]|nr:MarR family transcriptional regulator [Oscillospiraceae bacterium]